ncbi:hypothetical protein FCM35_KLT10511 [Carex littledalei]|uniref:Uncharacterized protein n=1 Tax=Carex littledalei TaxID=544730 RepID=A0A833VGN3_9POAL|nr:hypothetical protein FCM35_KLT10511 [Carex littledalei]
MKGIRRMWWVPLIPVSYYSAYKLTEIPPGHNPFDSLTYIVTPIPQKIREEQFKTGHLYSEFIRLKRGWRSDVAGELQTSIVRYEEKSPNQLSNRKLRGIQRRLRRYDCVLYEGLYVNSTDVEEVTAAKQQVNSHQKGADKYGLVRRYSVLLKGQNWKNADLTLKTYLQLEEERLNRWWKEHEKNKEGRKIIRITQIVLACLKHVLTVCSLCLPLPAFVPLITYLTCSRDAPNCHDIDKLEKMFKLGFLHYYVEDSKFSDAYKAVYKYDVDYEGDSDFASKAVVIRERNKFAMEVLKETIAEGKTTIAILYSAGNMPDFHKRLVKELDMVPVTVSWYTAWSIKEGPKSKFIHPLLENFQIENRTFILGTLIFALLVGDLWAWRRFGFCYWIVSWVFRFGFYFCNDWSIDCSILFH